MQGAVRAALGHRREDRTATGRLMGDDRRLCRNDPEPASPGARSERGVAVAAAFVVAALAAAGAGTAFLLPHSTAPPNATMVTPITTTTAPGSPTQRRSRIGSERRPRAEPVRRDEGFATLDRGGLERFRLFGPAGGVECFRAHYDITGCGPLLQAAREIDRVADHRVLRVVGRPEQCADDLARR